VKEKIEVPKKLPEQQMATPVAANRREQILEAARRLMVEEGVSAVTMRGVARAAGIAPGHLGYYFPNYDSLLEALLDWVITPYLQVFEDLRGETGQEPVVALRTVMNYVLEDLASKDTTHFFPSLWVLANHGDNARQQLRVLYDKYLNVLEELIIGVRPDLSSDNVSELALFICASIEGQTVFIGHQRPYARNREALRSIALDSLTQTVLRFEGSAKTR
jgi:AcrR family transcriptional regulator